jgi:hypothetical protein
MIITAISIIFFSKEHLENGFNTVLKDSLRHKFTEYEIKNHMSHFGDMYNNY